MKKSVLILILILVIAIPAAYFLKQNKLPDKIAFGNIKDKEPSFELNNFEYYKFVSDYTVTVKNVKDMALEIRVPLPETIQGKQIIKDLEYSVAPKEITRENGSNEAIFEIDKPQKQTKITISGHIGIKPYDYYHANKNPNAQILPLPENRYLEPEQYIESDDSEIIAKANELKGNTIYNTVKNVYYFVQRTMKYDASKDTIGAKKLLQTRKGKCSDYSALMVALLRANGIPARIVSGNVVEKESIEHTWVEVYFDNLGWVEFDPTIISKRRPDFSKSPFEYLISGINTINPLIVKLKVPVKDNRPRPDIIILLEGETHFFDAETNEPI